MGEVEIQMPFRNFGILFEVTFLLQSDNVPTFLIIKSMLQNELDVSIQEQYRSCKYRREPINMVNFFLIYHGSQEYLPYILYTQT